MNGAGSKGGVEVFEGIGANGEEAMAAWNMHEEEDSDGCGCCI